MDNRPEPAVDATGRTEADVAIASAPVDAGKYRNVHVSSRPDWFHLTIAVTLTAIGFLLGAILCCLIVIFAA